MSGQAKVGSGGGGGLALLSLTTAGKSSSSSSNLRSLTEMWYCDSFQGPPRELTAGEGRRNFQRYNH